MGHPSRISLLALVSALVIGLLGACDSTTPPNSAQVTPAPPSVELVVAPASLCRSATQLRLLPYVTGAWPADAEGDWVLTAASHETVLNQGTWEPAQGELFVAFPNGEALAPGRYTVVLSHEGRALAEHTVRIEATSPAVTNLALTLTPAGPEVERLDTGSRHAYLRYAYEGACPGAPYWLTVRFDGETVCTAQDTLEAVAGTGAISCYRRDGEPLKTGTYHAEFTLMGEARRVLTFEVGDPPATPVPPTPTPTPLPSACGPMFAAAGLLPSGEPFLESERFEWYTQIIYVGSRCGYLPAGTPWEVRWYRNGDLVRVGAGAWDAGNSGVIWDSLTDDSGSLFLLPGTYTVTLDLTDAMTRATQFRLVGYTPSEPEE